MGFLFLGTKQAVRNDEVSILNGVHKAGWMHFHFNPSSFWGYRGEWGGGGGGRGSLKHTLYRYIFDSHLFLDEHKMGSSVSD